MWDNKPNYPFEVCLKNINKQAFGKYAYFGAPLDKIEVENIYRI